MNRTALIELKAKVEAGEWDDWCEMVMEPHPYCSRAAFHGSLDAAKVLHEAVLPGWEWHLGPSNARVYPYNGSPMKSWSGMADNPARAWLLAILSALIAMETDREEERETEEGY